MAKQARLDLWEDRPDRLWSRLPDDARRTVTELYARLIARAAKAHADEGGTDR